MILHLNNFKSRTQGECCKIERDFTIWKIQEINDDSFMGYACCVPATSLTYHGNNTDFSLLSFLAARLPSREGIWKLAIFYFS